LFLPSDLFPAEKNTIGKGHTMTTNMTDTSAVVDDAAGSIKSFSSMGNLTTPTKGRSGSTSIESPSTLENDRLSTIAEATSVSDSSSDNSIKGGSVQIEADTVLFEADHDVSSTVVTAGGTESAIADDGVNNAVTADGPENAGTTSHNDGPTSTLETATIDVPGTVDDGTDGSDTSEPTDNINSIGKTDEEAGSDSPTALKIELAEDDFSCISSRPASRSFQDSEADGASIAEESTTTAYTQAREDSETFRVTSYHIDADLYVKVRESGETVMYKVHSALIAAASAVWRKAIYGGECPRPATGRWVMQMLAPEDDAFGLDVMFSLIHYKFHELPGSLTVDEMYGLARVAEKYNCAHIMIPHMAKW
jgi:hypothetical protein